MQRLVAWAMSFVVLISLGGCQQKASEAQSQLKNGLRFEYGLVLDAAPRLTDSPAYPMHNGAPRPTNTYHVVLALFDAASGARIADDDVAMTLSGPGHSGAASLPMDAMAVGGQASYGRYVVLPEPGTYRMTFDVRRPGRSPSHVKAAFKFRRPG